MRKILILLLCLCVLTLASCSKKKKNEAEQQPAAKTVDLGETDEENNEEANAPKGKKPPKDEMKRERHQRPMRGDGNKDGDNDILNKDKLKPKGDATPDADKPKEDVKNADAKAKDDEPAPKADDATAKPDGADDNSLDFTNDEPQKAEDNPAPQPPRPPKPKAALEIEKFINIRELREQTGFSGALMEDWLLGQNNDARYTSARLATDKPDQLGFTVQVWKPGNEINANKRFNDLYKQSFGGQKITGVATEAFMASHHKIHELGFYEKSKRAAVLLSCSEEVCTKEQLKSIALVIQRRL